MNKKHFIIIILLHVNFTKAQTPDWTWARCSKSVSSDAYSFSLASDPFGSIYVAGNHTDTVFFDKFMLKGAPHYSDLFLVKYDSGGNAKWAKSETILGQFGGGNAHSVCTDAFGNCYLTGSFGDSVAFDSFKLYSAASFTWNIFLTKYNSLGNVVWAKSAGGLSGSDADIGQSVTTDIWGNIYLAGHFSSKYFSYGPNFLTNGGKKDIFLAKYNSSGDVLWAISAGGSNDDAGLAVTTDLFGNIYLTGYFSSSSINFGTHVLTNPGSASQYSKIFIAKFDGNGNALWAKSAGGNLAYDLGQSLTTDAWGNIYLAGSFYSPNILFDNNLLTNVGGCDGFITKYDSDGNNLWAKGIAGQQYNGYYTIKTDKYKRIYLSGGFYNTSNLTIDTIQLQKPISKDSDPVFIASFDTAGHVLFVKTLPGGGDYNSIEISPQNSLYLGGRFQQVNPFIIGTDTLALSGGATAYVAKATYNSLISYFTSNRNVICTNDNNCLNFYDHSNGKAISWQWQFQGAVPDKSNDQNPTNICYNNSGSYYVSLIVSDGLNYDTLTVNSMIFVGDPPRQPFIKNNGDTLTCDLAASYQWYFNNNPIIGATNFFYIPNEKGSYSVLITDKSGCSIHSATSMVLIPGFEIFPNPVENELNIQGWNFDNETSVMSCLK